MRYLVVCLIPLLLCAPLLAWSAPTQSLDANRIAGKLWLVIDVTREYRPQNQVHVILEAPDSERLTLTFHDKNAQTLVRHDVIELEPKAGFTADIPDEAQGDFFIPHRVKLGKMRWLSERVKHEGKEINKSWRLFLDLKRGEETKI
jgi:hypothetical protein